MPHIRWVGLIVGLICLAGGGCACQPRPANVAPPLEPCGTAPQIDSRGWVLPENAELGYTIVLPGIWGSRALDHRIVQGLVKAHTPCAIDLCDWTEGPLLLLSNLRALDRNRREAQTLARKIMAYQDRYPGRPVNLIGYSGGAAMAVLTLEALPPERKVSSAVLLAATLAPDYDLRTATSRTERGIHSFYSLLDVPLLMVMTTAVGTSEGRHSFAAGAVGFQTSAESASDPAPSAATVVQRQYTWDMLQLGHPGGHFGWTHPAFIAQWVAPLIGTPAPGDPGDSVR
jgi:pimeloyl-ACP methyl ester carboxylesterase